MFKYAVKFKGVHKMMTEIMILDLSGFSNVVRESKIFNYGMVVYELNNYVDQWKGQDKTKSIAINNLLLSSKFCRKQAKNRMGLLAKGKNK
jgi:hypothetical protein